MKKILLGSVFSAVCVGLFLGGFDTVQPVKADEECRKNGKQVATTDGTLVCDCMATTGFNCGCILPGNCPPLND